MIEVHEEKPKGRWSKVTITVKEKGMVVKKMDFLADVNERITLKVVK